jgi:hypothetical protein
MKPSNVLIRADDGSATVMDFGIAKVTTSTRLTATGQTMGTVRYMSPEQVRGLEVDARTDIYSLGATLFEAVCGDTPFDGDTHFAIMTKHLTEPPPALSDVGVAVPPGFEAALLRTLAKEPEDRFASARELRKELERLLREHDPNWVDSLRSTRVAMALDDSARRLATAPDTPQALRHSRPIAGGRALTDQDKLEMGAAATASLRTTDGLSDEGAAAVDEVTSEPRSGPQSGRRAAATEPPEPARSPGRLWLGVAAGAVIAAAAMGFYLYDGGLTTPAAATERSGPSPGTFAKAAPRWPEAFTPPGAAFAVDETLDGAKVRVLAPQGWDAKAVARARDAGHALFSEMLIERKLAKKVAPQPLSIVVVPQRVFCDPRVYETGTVAQDCRDKEVLYRPKEHTLLVVDEPTYLDVNIAYGNALAVCLHSEIAGCDDVIPDIDREFDKRRRKAGSGARQK